MTFEEAVREMIRKYFDGKEPKEYKKAVGARKNKYTKEYFDSMERELGLSKDTEDGDMKLESDIPEVGEQDGDGGMDIPTDLKGLGVV